MASLFQGSLSGLAATGPMTVAMLTLRNRRPSLWLSSLPPRRITLRAAPLWAGPLYGLAVWDSAHWCAARTRREGRGNVLERRHRRRHLVMGEGIRRGSPASR